MSLDTNLPHAAYEPEPAAPGLAAAPEVDLSLVVCTKNRAHYLAQTLRSYLRIKGNVRWELIVVDNGSTDDTVNMLESFREEFGDRLRTERESLPGLGRARNRGWRAARGPVVAFSDDDCYPAEDYCRRLLECFRERPGVAFVGGRILLYDDRDQPITIQTRREPAELGPGSFVPAGLIQGANFAFRRATLERIGGFDERMGAGTPFPCEDVEALARATAYGYSGIYDSRPTVYHHHRRRSAADVLLLSKSYDYGRGGYYAKCLMNRSLRRVYGRAWLRRILKQPAARTWRELTAAIRFVAGSRALSARTRASG